MEKLLPWTEKVKNAIRKDSVFLMGAKGGGDCLEEKRRAFP